MMIPETATTSLASPSTWSPPAYTAAIAVVRVVKIVITTNINDNTVFVFVIPNAVF